jgi:hypothetical protein
VAEEAVAVAGVAEEVVEGVAEEAVEEEEAAAADNRAGTTQPLLNGGKIHGVIHQ